MNSRLIGLALFAVGIVLLVFAANASDSFSSFLSELFQGTPSGRSVLLLVGGILATVLGLVRLARSPAPR
jgi:spore maturation protein SpmA